jgi:hypothetical protein
MQTNCGFNQKRRKVIIGTRVRASDIFLFCCAEKGCLLRFQDLKQKENCTANFLIHKVKPNSYYAKNTKNAQRWAKSFNSLTSQ